VPDAISIHTVDQVVLLHTFSGHSSRVLDVAFSAQGEWLASSGQDKKIQVWDVRKRQKAHTLQMQRVDRADIDISTARNILASGEGIWDLESMQELYPLELGTQTPAFVAFTPDGSHLALGRLGQDLTLWDVTSGQPVLTFAEQEEKRTKRIEFSPDGALLAAGVIDGTVRLYDTESGDVVNTLPYGGETDIHDVAFSPDGAYLASAGRVSAVILWDVASGQVVRTFSVRDTVLNVDFSPDGTLLAASAGAEKAILLWEVESGNLVRSLPHEDQSMSIAFSPDGSLLAAACFDSQVYLWGIPTAP
jgi:WD40 repeat protein